MKEIGPFKYNIGDVVYAFDIYQGVVKSYSTLVVRRFRTTKGNVYTTTNQCNIREEFLLSREEMIVSTLAGKLLEK